MKFNNYINILKNMSDNGELYWYEYENANKNLSLPYSFSTSILLNNKLVESWGSDFNKDLAIKKSVMELFERIVYEHHTPTKFYRHKNLFSFLFNQDIWNIKKQFNYNGWLHCNTTSGVAIHTSKKEATNNAISELIERHVIIKSFALKVTPKKLNQIHLLNNYSIPNDINLDLYHWKGPLKHNVVMSKINKGEHNLFAFGCSNNLDKAIKKSFLEASSMIMYFENIKNPIYSGIKKTTNNYYEHNPSHGVFDYLDSKFIDNCIDTDLEEKDFYLCEYDVDLVTKTKSNLYCIRAISPKLQGLFKDSWHSKYINHKTIKLNKDELPKYPHFYC